MVVDLPPHEKMERGFKAKSLLNSEMFQEMLATLDARYVEAWRNAKTVELREDAHKFVRLIEWFRDDLQSVANTGDLTEARMKALQEGEMPKLEEFKR